MVYCQCYLHIFISIQRCIVVVMLISAVMNLVLGVEMMLFIRHCVVVRLAVLVVVVPGKASVPPLTVTRTRYFSAFCGLILARSLVYVTFLFCGTRVLDMNCIVLVPFFMRVPPTNIPIIS